MEDIEIEGIKKAIELSKKCKPEDNKPHPRVGAVIIKDHQIVCEAYRGERSPGDHAEYTALTKKCGEMDLTGATLIATLEPCTTRKHDKKPCAQHIVDKGIKKVIVGMIDPNPEIRGKGILFLQQKNISVDHFPAEYFEQVKQLNKGFWNMELKKYKFDLMKDPGSETDEKKNTAQSESKSYYVVANDDRSVAIGGNANSSTIITGDQKAGSAR